ncbi:hypothetical protein ACI68E_004129 [Malassezia pachydermatis]|uniref:Hd phosphohydrolase n=1 Tax=Malassezia pachydermatis TaxID=77020 RepID=A0A0M8MT24_9BASI|nr:hd phosphohydrolase [Malassezia pachydermatis]KOS13774.1 hd phosphohydrolase [Malassezia pachydermatis]
MAEGNTSAEKSIIENAKTHVSYIFKLLKDQGQGDYLGEAISQLEHCLQAAYLAEQEVDDDEIIIATLLHDIGQFLPLNELGTSAERMFDSDLGANVGRGGHDTLGKDWLLAHNWPQRVADLVGAHVIAKR